MFEQLVQTERFTTKRENTLSDSVFNSIVTQDPGMDKIFNVIERVADTQSTVLILGESGTGKELIARAIHTLSGVKGNFVPVNCGAIPDNLLESELFGYEKGAFTGANNSKPGRFVLADGGTIFLDEIGDMSPHLQVKLLRVLQDQVVEPVGGLKPKSVKVRIIAATNVDLRNKVKEGKFREDLFYRLQVVPVELPALRDRKEDLELLLTFFAGKYASQVGRRPITFSEEVVQLLELYRWPGNVRELENLVQRLTLLVEGDEVRVEDMPMGYNQNDDDSDDQFLSYYPSLPGKGADFNSLVETFENQLIMQALERTNGNKKAAAELLNLNRTTLVEKIKKKGLLFQKEEE